MAKRLSRRTKGVFQQVFVTTNINETDDATYGAFLTNAPVGEIGVFNDALSKRTVALTAAESFFIAQKHTNGTKKTQNFKVSNTVFRKKLYTAPVKCKIFVGWNGTGGSMYAPTMAVGLEYEFAVIETTEGNQPFPKWNYNYVTRSGDVEMDAIQKLVTQINDLQSLQYKGFDSLVTAKAKANATYGNFTLGGTTPTLTVTNNSTLVTLAGTTPTFDAAVGDFISFDAAATPTGAIGDIYKVVAVSAGVSFTLNRPYQGATQTFTQAEAQGTRIKKVTAILATGIELTGINNDEIFKIAVRSAMENATVTLSAYTHGNGTYQNVKELEDEGTTIDGETVKNAEFSADYGLTDKFASSTGTYNYYMIESTITNNESSSFVKGSYKAFVMIAAHAGSANQTTYFNTLFGV